MRAVECLFRAASAPEGALVCTRRRLYRSWVLSWLLLGVSVRSEVQTKLRSDAREMPVWSISSCLLKRALLPSTPPPISTRSISTLTLRSGVESFRRTCCLSLWPCRVLNAFAGSRRAAVCGQPPARSLALPCTPHDALSVQQMRLGACQASLSRAHRFSCHRNLGTNQSAGACIIEMRVYEQSCQRLTTIAGHPHIFFALPQSLYSRPDIMVRAADVQIASVHY